jgi:hypothetical protein
MTPFYADRRARRDFLASGSAILLLTGLMILISMWYMKPRQVKPVPPAVCRVTMIPPGLARAALAPIHFSLPSKIGFSRTVQPGDPRLVTKLGTRPEDVRFLPREAKPDPLLAEPEKAPLPAFTPWRGDPPVFDPVAPVPADGAVTIEPLEGATLVLPPDLNAAARWPASGPWSAVVRLEAGADGRVEHVFLMPPAPEPALRASLERLMRQARVSGGAREARVRISRMAAPAGTGTEREGTKP